jgi:lysozyme
MDALKALLDTFKSVVLQGPPAVKIGAAVFLAAVIGYIVYVLLPPPRHEQSASDFEKAYQAAWKSLNPGQPPFVVETTVENLFHLATTDRQRCDAGNLYLSIATSMPHPLEPPSLNEFLIENSAKPPPCVVALTTMAKQTQTRQVAAATTEATTAPNASPSPKPLSEAGTRTSAAAQVLQATTTVGTSGYMYLGDVAAGNRLVRRTIANETIPSAGDSVVVETNTNIRDTKDPRADIGRVVGVASKGSTITLTGPVVRVPGRVPGSGRTLAWAPVTLSTKVNPQVAAPPSAAVAQAPTPAPAGTIAPVRSQSGSVTVPGIDVSSFAGAIDWKAVAQTDVRFAILRATQGTKFEDERLAANWSGSQAAGLVRGAYHVYEAGSDPERQARFFASHVTLQAGDLPPMADFELHGAAAGASVKEFVAFVAALDAATHRTSVIYAPYADLVTLFAAAPQLANHPIWIASYGEALPQLPGGRTNWTFWQYSGTGRVNGIRNDVDLDRFNGSEEALRAFASR